MTRENQEPRVLVVGSVALDSVKTCEGNSREALGGSAVYFSLSGRFFARVSMVGVVGRDFPKRHREMLERCGVDVRGIEVRSGKTFRWIGRFGEDMAEAQTLETHLNVFLNFRPRLSSEHRKIPVVFLANIDPEIQAEVLSQMRRPRLVALDTMNYWISSKKPALKKLLKRVNIFFVNAEEAKVFSGEKNLLRAAAVISSWGPQVVVIKKGEHGCLMKAGRHFYAYPAFPMEAVKDPTGAGDTFAGAFIGSLAAASGALSNNTLKRALLCGTTAASFNIEGFSTRRMERLSAAELHERMERFRELLSLPGPQLSSFPVSPAVLVV